MSWGTIKNVTLERGFGYILPGGQTNLGPDLYFNRKDVKGATTFDDLRAGQRVEYDLSHDQRRGTPLAMNVRILSPS